MTQEDMINILNQHGLDVLYNVISDEISTKETHAYSSGYELGYNDAKDELQYASSDAYDRGYRVGYNDGLNHSWCRYTKE